MLTVRHYQPSDEEALKKLHAEQGFEYELPNFADKNILVNAVVENEQEKIEMAVVIRRTSEAYLLLDPKAGTHKEVLGKILMMQRELKSYLGAMRIRDVHCWLPPDIDANFGKLLMHIGWKKPTWSSYFLEIN